MWCFCGLPGMLYAVCVCVCMCVCLRKHLSLWSMTYSAQESPLTTESFSVAARTVSLIHRDLIVCVFLCVCARTCALAPLKASIHQFFSWYSDSRRSSTVYTACSPLCRTITETNPNHWLCNVLLVCPMMNSNIQWRKHTYGTCNGPGSALIVVMPPIKHGSCLKGNIGWWTGCGLCAHASTLEQNRTHR